MYRLTQQDGRNHETMRLAMPTAYDSRPINTALHSVGGRLKGCVCHTDLMHIVAELSLRDGPRSLVVPLESSNLTTKHGGVSITIVIHTLQSRQITQPNSGAEILQHLHCISC